MIRLASFIDGDVVDDLSMAYEHKHTRLQKRRDFEESTFLVPSNALETDRHNGDIYRKKRQKSFQNSRVEIEIETFTRDPNGGKNATHATHHS